MIKTQAALKHYLPLIARCQVLATRAAEEGNTHAYRYWIGRRDRHYREYIDLLATIKEN